MVRLGSLLEESVIKEKVFDNDIVTFIGMQDVSEDAKLVTQHLKKYSDVKKGLTYFAKNDVLVAKITPCFENGKGAFLNVLETNVGFGSTEFHVLRANSEADAAYIYQHTKTKAFRAKLEMDMVGTAGHKRVPLLAVLNYGLPVKHTKEEQGAIAKALSDVDELIVSLEKLIAKKRDIKTATMQQLLTGKKRLAGFDSEWGKIKIENDAILKARIGWQALTTNEYLEFGAFHLVTGTDFINGRINWSTCHYVDKWRFDQDRNIQLKEGDVLITKDGTIGKVGYVDHLDIPSTLNSGVFVIRPVNEAFHPLFLYYILSSRIFDEFLSKITAGSTITHLYQKDFINFEFKAPNVVEQIEIANILESLDKDVDCCQKQLDKAKSIKQGMMQELLTGRTRLI